MWTKMCVVAIDPANRTREVGSQIRVFSLLGRAIRVLVNRGRIIISGGIRVLTSLLGRLVVCKNNQPIVFTHLDIISFILSYFPSP